MSRTLTLTPNLCDRTVGAFGNALLARTVWSSETQEQLMSLVESSTF